MSDVESSSEVTWCLVHGQVLSEVVKGVKVRANLSPPGLNVAFPLFLFLFSVCKSRPVV